MLIFQEIVDSIESLPIQDQDYLFELIRKRRIENERVETLVRTQESKQPLEQTFPIQNIKTQKTSALGQLTFDPKAPPIWEVVAQISAQVPDEEWKKLPTDLARRFDDYQKQRQGQD